MKNKCRFQKGLITPAAGFLIAAGLIRAESVSASLWLDCVQSSDNCDAVSPSIFTRTSVLWSTPAWQEFKRIWRKLGDRDPIDGEYGSSVNDQEDLNKIRTELYSSIDKLMSVSGEIGIDSLDIRLLHRLASDRLSFLSWGTAMPLTRMMPPPVSDQTDDLIPEIEARIDTVLRLRENDLISSDEMVSAFNNLRSTIDTYFLLETVSDEIGYSGVLWSIRWPGEPDRIPVYLDSLKRATLADLENASEEYAAIYTEQLDELDRIESSLNRTRSRLPALHDLLIDLELF